MDIEGLPLPENAPEPGSCVRMHRPEGGLAELVLDPPHRSMAVLDVPLLRDFDLCLDEIEQDSSLRGLVITGKDPLSFAVGADIDAIGGVTDVDLARRMVRSGQAVFQRLHLLSRSGGGRLKVVAAVGGPVPGGACELALACDLIVLSDHDKSRIGLPEVKLGIYPGWGGTQRLPRRIGLPAAMGAILSGRLYAARQAKKMGLVDRLTPPEYLLRIARNLATGRERHELPTRGWRSFAIDRNPVAKALIAKQSHKQVMAQTKGHYPAPLKAIEMVIAASSTPLEAGLEAEAHHVAPLIVNSVTKSLVGLFHRSEEAKALAKLPNGEKAGPIARGAVIGGGVMGGGIAGLMAERGVATRLRDLSQEALDTAQLEHRKSVDKKRKRRRLKPHQADAAIDRLEVTTEAIGFDRCEIAIEAVAEVLEIKRSVFGELAERMAPDAILATNTSSLSVAEIAEGLPNPERVIGLHFFNPVPKMPLVEIVRGPATSDEVVARTARLAIDLGKTPVVTTDVAGFLVNRLLGPYLDEALRMFENGADPAAIDRAMLEFGMPMGPFALLDEVGLDIAAHAAASLHKAYGERMTPSACLAPLVEAGEVGKKSERGIFLWEKGKKGRLEQGSRNPRLSRGAAGMREGARADSHLEADEIVDRLILAMAGEAARALEEGVVAGAGELDLATVFGMGFPPFRGGLARYLDARGISTVEKRMRELAESPGVVARNFGPARYEPADWITTRAAEGRSFSS